MVQDILLVPGLLCNDDLWRDQKMAFSGQFCLTVLDHTHHDRLSLMVAAALQKAPKTFHLAGLSMGGYVAFEIMRQAAQRVKSLILLDTSARADRPEQVAQRQALIDRADTEDIARIARTLTPHLIHPAHQTDPILCARIIAMAEDVGAKAFQRQQTALINRPDSRDFLSKIRCPVQIICGAEDQLTPPKVHQEMAAQIPHARFAVIPRCGHLSPMEKPEAVSAIMADFLVKQS